MLAVCIQKSAQSRQLSVAGKAEVTYPPCRLLLEEIVQYPVFRVEILLDVALADVVEEVEVEVLDAAAFQLFREDFAHLSHVFEVISGEFVGQEIALAGIFAVSAADGGLARAVVVAVGCVEVVDAVRVGVVDDALGGLEVNPAVVAVDDRQAHVAHTEPADFQPPEVPVNHAIPPKISIICALSSRESVSNRRRCPSQSPGYRASSRRPRPDLRKLYLPLYDPLLPSRPATPC